MILMQTKIAACAVGLSLLAGSISARAAELHSVQATPNALTSPATVTPATSGSWSGSIGGPTLYNTGKYFQTADIVPPAGTPTTGTISTIYFNWAFQSYATGIYIQLCDNIKCVVVVSNASGSSGSASTTAFSGDPSGTDISFAFAKAGNGSAINPPIYSGRDSITVNYNN